MAVYNVDKISNWYDDFTNLKNKFNNTYYSDYKSCYIRTCTDDAVQKMKNKLNVHYSKIQKIYNNINNSWKEYLIDLKNTDKRLAGGKGSINASSVSYKISKLPTLQEYKTDLGIKIKSISGVIGTAKGLRWSEDKTVGQNLGYFGERCAATVTTAGCALVEGLTKLAEDAVDLLVLAGAVGASRFTAVVDGVNHIASKVTGDESLKTNYTKQLWENTRAFVSTDYTKQVFDSFYDNTSAGNWIKENAYGFDTVREIGSEIGEVMGVVALSAATGGSAAVLYGAAKAAEHTEENWQDENTSTAGGLFKGILQGTGDGVFFALGSKGDKLAQSAAKKAVDSGSKTILKKTGILGGKMIFEGGCSIAQDCSNILINTVFSNDSINGENGETIKFNNFTEKWDYYYNEAGGTKGLMTSVATASIMSGLSDSFDIYKVKGTSAVAKNADIDIDANLIGKNSSDINVKSVENNIKSYGNVKTIELSKEYDDLLKKSKEDWFISAKEARDNGWAWKLNDVKEVDDTVKRMEELESILGIENTGTFKSGIYDYSQAKKEADELARKISEEPIPIMKKYMVDPDSDAYKSGIEDIYTTPGPTSKQVLDDNIGLLKKHSSLSEIKLKRIILDSTDSSYNEIQKFRKIYIELNKRTNYDVDFVLGDEETKKAILKKFTTFDNLNGSNVVCKGWSELYAEALVEAGIDPNRVRVVKAQNARHWWVEIDMGDSIIRADATDAFLGSTDLANCKFGDSTNGFLILSKENSGFRISNDTLRNHPEILKKSNDYFRDVDKSIDYVKDSGYFTESVTKLKKAFSNETSPYDDIIKQGDFLKGNVHRFMDMDIPKNMNGYDAFAYYRKFSNALFENGNGNAIPSLKKINVDGKDYSAVVVEMFDGENKFYLTFDEINGKKIYTHDEYISGPSKNYKQFK